MRRLLLAALALTLAAPAVASAADPVLPLGGVRAGMRCTGLSVVKGTEIARFDVEVVDVVGAERLDSARILARVSGPAVDATGVGPGFSGSPVYCPGADGIERNIGAIAEGIGDYGGFTVLLRPIEAILAAPIMPPASVVGARSRAAPVVAPASVVGARSLAGPLTVAGVRPEIGRALVAAARRRGRLLVSAPASTTAPTPAPALAPGAAVALGLTSGDVRIGAVGTVAYTAGDDVWAFGHEFEGAGRRTLFLQDAVVHEVVANPVNSEELSTYKLASPGNDRGTISGDAPSAVTGRLGAPPPEFPLRVTARDRDTGRLRVSVTRIADEGDVGRPSGPGMLGLVASTAVADVVTSLLSGSPARQRGDMCLTIRLRDEPAPLRFCNAYSVDGSGPNALAGAMVQDAAAGVGLVDGYRFGALHPTAIEIGIRVRRGVRQAFLVSAAATGPARRGRRLGLRLRLRMVGSGKLVTRHASWRVPTGVGSGRRTLRLVGAPGDAGADPLADDDAFTVLFEDESDADAPGPQSVAALRAAIAGLQRDTRPTARLGRVTRPVSVDPALRVSGSARVGVLIGP